MDCTFKWTGMGGNVCLKEERNVTKFQYRHYCSHPKYYECPFYNNKEGKDIGKSRNVDDMFITIIYGMLGKTNDGKEMIAKFYKFRREVLEKDINCYDILVCQDRLSPLIRKKIGCIINDAIIDCSNLINLSKFINDIIYNEYMLPISSAIDNRKFKDAKKLYREMIYKLLEGLDLIDKYNEYERQYRAPEKHRPVIKKRRPIGRKHSW